MSPKLDDLQKMSKDQMQVASAAAMSVATGLQSMASEAGDYSKKVFETSSALVEKLLGAKSIESAVQIQSDYARSAYETFVAQTTKFGEIYGTIAKEAMRPVETAMSKVQSAA